VKIQRHLKYLLLLLSAVIAFAFGCGDLNAAYYYIDREAAGANDGSSWKNAWRGFSHIDWRRISSGDTIFVSGGSTSKAYREPLVIEASGAGTKPVTITRGKDAGHDGDVVFDGCNIVIHKRSHVTVSRFRFQNFTGKGAVHISESRDIVADSNTMDIYGHGGVFVEESRDCIVRNNTMSTSDDTTAQTDGIYAQRNRGNIYEKNHIVIRNRHPEPHADCIQTFQETDAIIRNNYFEQDNIKSSNAQGIFSTEGSGVHKYYNNVVKCPHSQSNLIGFRNRGRSDGTVHVYNNTVVGRSGNLIRISGRSSIVKNNVVLKSGKGYLMRFEDPIADPRNIDYNIYFNAGGDVVYSEALGSSKSWPKWRALGMEAHGMLKHPELDSDFRPSADSPAVDAGCSLAGDFTTDKDGAARPQGAAWDIGAYERSK